MRNPSRHPIATLAALAVLSIWTGAAAAQAPRTVQPGVPGEAGRTVTATEISRTSGPPHTEADVQFMQGMIHHHLQALVMTDMVATRTTNPNIRLLARRIELSQDDEIHLMRTWLEDRGEAVPHIPGADEPAGAMDHCAMGHLPAEQCPMHADVPRDHDQMDHAQMDHAQMDHGQMDHGQAGHAHGDDGMLMPGMLTQEELDRLAAASGPEFDRLFLEYMIKHHEGAIIMVADLFSTGGAGQEEEIFTFASHVEADQSIEIRRMLSMLGTGR